MMSDGERCQLRPSLHAQDRLVERGITQGEILEAINKGAKRIHGERIIVLFRGFELVYRPMPCNYFIITVYWKR